MFFLFSYPILNTILFIALFLVVLGVYFYIRRKNILWKNESAAYIHTEAIIGAIDEVPETIAVVNKEGLIIYVNNTSATMFGKKEADLLEKSIYHLVPLEYKDLVEKAKREDHRETFEIVAKNRLAVEIPLEITISRKESATGTILYTFILKDISHRRKGETTKSVAIDELKKDCELLSIGESLLKSGSWVWDMTKEPDEVRYSKGFAKIFDIPAGHLLPASKLMESVYIGDRELVNKIMLAAMEKSEGYEIEYRVSKRNGRKDLVKCVAHPGLTENGKMIRLTGTIQLIKENVN